MVAYSTIGPSAFRFSFLMLFIWASTLREELHWGQTRDSGLTTGQQAVLSAAFGLSHRDSSGALVKRARRALERSKTVERRIRKIEKSLCLNPESEPNEAPPREFWEARGGLRTGRWWVSNAKRRPRRERSVRRGASRFGERKRGSRSDERPPTGSMEGDS